MRPLLVLLAIAMQGCANAPYAPPPPDWYAYSYCGACAVPGWHHYSDPP